MDGSSSQNMDLGNRKGGLALHLSPGIETAYMPANASMPLSAPMRHHQVIKPLLPKPGCSL